MTKHENLYTPEQQEELLDAHLGTSLDTPLRSDAFDLSNEDKIVQIAEKFEDIMILLGLDLKDDSLSGTPLRVAKMYVNEAFSGLNPLNKPQMRLFENKYEYKEMLIEKNIKVHSHCEHHFVPIIGKCHVNRIVRHYAKRPQVQERLTRQIAEALMEGLQTEHVAVYLEADHMCVKTRGVEDDHSSTVTMAFHGDFNNGDAKRSFLESFR